MRQQSLPQARVRPEEPADCEMDFVSSARRQGSKRPLHQPAPLLEGHRSSPPWLAWKDLTRADHTVTEAGTVGQGSSSTVHLLQSPEETGTSFSEGQGTSPERSATGVSVTAQKIGGRVRVVQRRPERSLLQAQNSPCLSPVSRLIAVEQWRLNKNCLL